jgi:hypothetical protein
MNRLWHVDPDAMMVRKRNKRFHPDKELSLGLLNNDEARTIALNQYIGCGQITFTEYMPELGEERKSLYRHVIPSINSSSRPLDIFNPICPSQLLTEVKPKCTDLEPWVTVAIVNWSDDKKKMSLELSQNVIESLDGEHFLVFEFFSQRLLGIFTPGEIIDVGELAPHASALLRITTWDGTRPVLAGTDLHFSGGGVEMASWRIDSRIEGMIDTQWKYPVKVSVAFPVDDRPGFIEKNIRIEPGQRLFTLEFPD